MGSGKGSSKRTNNVYNRRKSRRIRPTNDLYKDLGNKNVKAYSRKWTIFTEERGFAKENIVKHYSPELYKKNKVLSNNEMGFILTEVLHDVLDNNLVSVFKATVDSSIIDYDRYEVKVEKNVLRDWNHEQIEDVITKANSYTLIDKKKNKVISEVLHDIEGKYVFEKMRIGVNENKFGGNPGYDYMHPIVIIHELISNATSDKTIYYGPSV